MPSTILVPRDICLHGDSILKRLTVMAGWRVTRQLLVFVYFILFLLLFIDLICRSTHLCIHWLILVCAPFGDQICNLGVSGQYSNQLSYPARASFCSCFF